MANKKITELQLIDEITEDLNLPVDDTIQTYRATIAQIKDFLAPVYLPPSVQRYATAGSTTWNKHYTFLGTGIDATVGATYTHNSVTYTVIETVASSNRVVLSGSAAPLASGTLTKSAGSGDATIVFTEFRPPIYLEVEVMGAGGGGSGTGTASQGTGGNGTSSGFDDLIAAAGGSGGNYRGQGEGGTGATVTAPAYAKVIAVGGDGGIWLDPVSTQAIGGAIGGSSAFGGAGRGGEYNNNGQPAGAATGGGGGGAGNNGTSSSNGTGGGAGLYVKAIVTQPTDPTYDITVGTGGSSGSAGTSGLAGGAGSDGLISITCHYQ
jgi:hypothetical protein